VASLRGRVDRHLASVSEVEHDHPVGAEWCGSGPTEPMRCERPNAPTGADPVAAWRPISGEAETRDGVTWRESWWFERCVREVGVAGHDAVGIDGAGEEHQVVVLVVAKHRCARRGVRHQATQSGEFLEQFVDFLERDEAAESRPPEHIVEFGEKLRGDD